MSNTTLIVLLFLVLTTPFTNLHAQTQITSCNTQFTDTGGLASNYLNNDNSEWLICPDDSTQYLSLTFTHVNIETADNEGLDSTGCYDVLYIYDGKDDTAPLVGSFCGEESGTGKSSFIDGHTLSIGDSFRPKNSEGCFYIRFLSDQSKNLSGWEADVTCCIPSLDKGLTDGIDIPIPNNNGNILDLVIDNSCTRFGTLDLFTEFEPSGEECFTKGLSFENQAFYAFTANSSGGFVELEIDSIDSVGIMEMVVFGPVTVDSLGNYIGGVMYDCVTGEDPWSLFFNAGPNKMYILGVATELPGKTQVSTLPFTVGLGGVLPVEMIEYNIRKKDQSIKLSWTTSKEINNDKFEIYRSFDGIKYDAIGTVEAADNRNEENTYIFPDTPNASGHIYYYVRQIDLDGKYTDYTILSTYLSNSVGDFTTFPNPSNSGKFSLNIDEEMLSPNAHFQMYDHLGKIVVNKKLNGTTSFDFQNLTPGLYIIKIISGSNIMTNQHLVYCKK